MTNKYDAYSEYRPHRAGADSEQTSGQKLSYWAQLRTEEDRFFDGAVVVRDAIAARWNEGCEGKLAIIFLAIFLGSLLIGGCLTLGHFFPTFDPAT